MSVSPVETARVALDGVEGVRELGAVKCFSHEEINRRVPTHTTTVGELVDFFDHVVRHSLCQGVSSLVTTVTLFVIRIVVAVVLCFVCNLASRHY